MPGTTPIYGFPYPEPTDLVADYPALGQDLAEDIEAALPGIPGLQLISPTSIANSGGTATSTNGTVDFSTVTSISVNGVFSATYNNYRIVLDFDPSGTNLLINGRFRTSGTDNTSASYNRQNLVGYGTSVGASRTTNETYFVITNNSGDRSATFIDLSNPFASLPTVGFNVASYGGATTSIEVACNSFGFNNTTSFDGMTVYPASGNLTGKLRIYGYKGA